MNKQTENEQWDDKEHILTLDIVDKHRKSESKPIKYIINKNTGCWECTSHFIGKTNPYPRIGFNGRQHVVPRLVLEESIGRQLDTYPNEVTRHKCDNPLCVNPDHLECGTMQDNVDDKMRRGRGAVGHRSGRRKLCKDEVVRIKELLRDGVRKDFIANKFNVSAGNISSINSENTWKEVEVEGFKADIYGNKRNLSKEDIERIDSMVLSGKYTQKSIASRFNVSPSLISKMKKELIEGGR